MENRNWVAERVNLGFMATMYRLRCIKDFEFALAGEEGGLVADPILIDQTSWVSKDSRVCMDAKIGPGTCIKDSSMVSVRSSVEFSIVSGSTVSDDSVLRGARVTGSHIGGSSRIIDSEVSSSTVSGIILVMDCSTIVDSVLRGVATYANSYIGGISLSLPGNDPLIVAAKVDGYADFIYTVVYDDYEAYRGLLAYRRDDGSVRIADSMGFAGSLDKHKVFVGNNGLSPEVISVEFESFWRRVEYRFSKK